MRVLNKAETQLVGGAHHAGTKPVAFDTHRSDNGHHYGWCRGHGNTGESNGHGNGVQLHDNVNKHGINVAMCGGRLR